MQVFQFFVRDAQLYAAQRIRLDQVHKLPADGPLRQRILQFTNHSGPDHPLQQPPHRPRQSDVHLREPQLHIAVGLVLGKIHVIHAHDFAALGVDNLLVEQILAHREPRLIGRVYRQLTLAAVQAQSAGRHCSHLVVARQQRLKTPARKQKMRDAVGLVRRLDKEFAHAPDEMPLCVVGLRAHQLRRINLHGTSSFLPTGPVTSRNGQQKTRAP